MGKDHFRALDLIRGCHLSLRKKKKNFGPTTDRLNPTLWDGFEYCLHSQRTLRCSQGWELLLKPLECRIKHWWTLQNDPFCSPFVIMLNLCSVFMDVLHISICAVGNSNTLDIFTLGVGRVVSGLKFIPLLSWKRLISSINKVVREV